MEGLSLRTNVPSLYALQNVETRSSLLNSDVEQLSSGERIHSAGDDPSGLAIATSLHLRVQGFQAAGENVQNARNATIVAEQALATISGVLQRIRSLAVQAASDISSASDRQSLQAEVNQLIDQINTTVRNTRFNGEQLIEGRVELIVNGTSIDLSVNDSGQEGERVALNLPDARALNLGVATVDVTSFASAENAIGQLDKALVGLLTERAQVGAQIVSLGEDADAGRAAEVGLTQSESVIRDANIGRVASSYTRDQILVQVGTSVLSQSNLAGNQLLALFHESSLPGQYVATPSVPSFNAAAVQAPATAPSAPQGASVRSITSNTLA